MVVGVARVDKNYHLLPHERWLVRVARQRRQSRPAMTTSLMDVNLGPNGSMLLAAMAANFFSASMACVVGAFLYLASGTVGTPAKVALWLMAVGVALIPAMLIRAFQADRAGRKFRGGRPPVRR